MIRRILFGAILLTTVVCVEAQEKTKKIIETQTITKTYNLESDELLSLDTIVTEETILPKIKTSNWTYKGNVGVNVSQTSFKNWALGGDGSISGLALLDLGANYAKDKTTWTNSFSARYGIQKIDDENARKNIDEFLFNSKYGHKLKEKWSASALLTAQSQFTEGYSYEDPKDTSNRTKISNLFAPGYISTGIGVDYKPNDFFSLYLSPLTGKFTFVLDEDLSEIGLFGVDAGDKFRAELGSLFKADFNRDVMKNINLKTNLTLFSAYDSYGNIDVNWDLLLSMKINKYISANISTSLLYDDDIEYIDENEVNHGPKIQFKEVIGVGFSYNIWD